MADELAPSLGADGLALHQWGADKIAQNGGDHGTPALGTAL